MNDKSRLALAVLLLTALSTIAPAQRLSRSVVPEHYDIHLAPDFGTDTFAGQVAINVRLTEPSRTITLHAAEIEFHEVAIAAGGTKQIASVDLNAGEGTAVLTVPQPVPRGAATIAIRYTGRLNDQLRGFYLSRANGRDYGITQLEATDARRAFPSFDEPALKATFAVSATIDSRDTAISNGRLLSDTPGPGAGKHTLRFATTKRMSTYLVALAVGDWVCQSGGADGIPIRVCGTPNRKDQLGFALESAEFSLRYFNRLFAVKYPFEKLDIIAVPDFSAGAMENTGAIIFREQFLVSPAEGADAERLKQISQFISHEIAHQWFGDLVTMEWWDDIWLNEGFATWMEYRPMGEWKPEWNAALEEVRDTQRAMALDALRATRPVRTRVETPEQINDVFDAIAYQKTAAVIRMVEGYVGAAAYRDGINAYLKKFAYGNATGEGFWTTMAAATGKPIDRVLQTFITQGSMPMVNVETRCNGGSTEVAISQQPVSPAVPASTLWEIPVCYKRERDGKVQPSRCILLSAKTHATTLDGCSPWVLANVDSRGYYRTAYDADDLHALGEAIAGNKLNLLEQTTLLEDLWTFVRLNERSIASYFSLSSRVIKSRLSPVISTALSRINFTSDSLIDDESLRPAFRGWVRATVAPLVEQMGWTPRSNESDDMRTLRSDALFTLGTAGADGAVRREARRLAVMHVTGAAPLHPSVADTVLRLGAIEGDASLYDQYLSRMRAASTPMEHLQYLVALTFFEDPALRTRTLAYATSDEIRSQDAPMLIGNLMRRPSSASVTWAHVKDNWDTVVNKFGIFRGIPNVVRSVASFCDAEARNDVEQFFGRNGVAGTDRALQQALETIQRCAATKSAQANNLSEFLRSPDP